MFEKTKKFYEDHKAEIVIGGTLFTIYTATILVSSKVAGLTAAKATAGALSKLPAPDEAAIAAEVATQINQQLLPLIKEGMTDFASEALGVVRQQVQQAPQYTTPFFRS